MDTRETSNSSSLLSYLTETLPQLEVVLPGSAQYPQLRKTYINTTFTPLAIVRPTTAEEVGSIVSAASTHHVKFTVRSGGHNLEGRCIEPDALMIDLRLINKVHIAPDKSAATIGGGTLEGDFLRVLGEQDLVTPFASVASIGHVGWATFGGYGALSGTYGLGVDQILGATVVDYKGELIEADENLLKGIRGGGGNLGIIVALKVKIYPFDSLLAGLIMFESSSMTGILTTFYDGLNKLRDAGEVPRHVYIQPMAFNDRERGLGFGVAYVWSSPDHEAGMAFLPKIAGLGKMLMHTVAPTSVNEWMEVIDQVCPYGVFGGCRTVSVKRFTPEIAEVIGRHLEIMPTFPGMGMSVHSLHGESAKSREGTCFAAREPHDMIEIISVVTEEKNAEAAQSWGKSLHNELNGCGEAMKASYVSLMREGSTSLGAVYGEHWKGLLQLKSKYDPLGTFSLAYPRIST